jgi:hypothetical protein
VLLFFLQVETFFSDLDFAGLDFFHYGDFLVGLLFNFEVFFVNLSFGDEECILKIGYRFLLIDFDLALLDADFDVEIGFALDEELFDGFELGFVFVELFVVFFDGELEVLHG